MDNATLLGYVQQAFYLALLITAPVAIAAALVTLVVGALQSVTSMHDQTVSNVPRMIAIYAAIAAGGAWAMREIVAAGIRILEQLAHVQ